MKTIFTRKEILQGSGCYRKTAGKAESIIGDAEQLTIQDILDLDFLLKYKFWFVRNNCELTTDQFRLLAIGVAEIVLPIYEEKYPENKAPREAIQAAKDYMKGVLSLGDLIVKRMVAYDAADAADAAYAAAVAYAAADANAADAAYAAYAAAVAAVAVAAAYDVADADDADAAAVDDADAVDAVVADDEQDYEKELLSFLKYFVNEDVNTFKSKYN